MKRRRIKSNNWLKNIKKKWLLLIITSRKWLEPIKAWMTSCFKSRQIFQVKINLRSRFDSLSKKLKSYGFKTSTGKMVVPRRSLNQNWSIRWIWTQTWTPRRSCWRKNMPLKNYKLELEVWRIRTKSWCRNWLRKEERKENKRRLVKEVPMRRMKILIKRMRSLSLINTLFKKRMK